MKNFMRGGHMEGIFDSKPRGVWPHPCTFWSNGVKWNLSPCTESKSKQQWKTVKNTL